MAKDKQKQKKRGVRKQNPYEWIIANSVEVTSSIGGFFLTIASILYSQPTQQVESNYSWIQYLLSSFWLFISLIIGISLIVWSIFLSSKRNKKIQMLEEKQLQLNEKDTIIQQHTLSYVQILQYWCRIVLEDKLKLNANSARISLFLHTDKKSLK